MDDHKYEVSIGEFTQNNMRTSYEVWDEKKEKWVEYKDSCYKENMEFPDPHEAKYPINLLTMKCSRSGRVATFGTEEYTGNSDLVDLYAYIPDELNMLERFIKWWRKEKIDIVTGWNITAVPSQMVTGFDITYIINRIKNLTESRQDRIGLENKLSPLGKVIYNERNMAYTIPGISIIDYLSLYKNFTFTTQPSYSLESIGQYEVGEGKIQFEGQIMDIYKTDWNKFVEYNIQDVLLVEKIELKKRFIALTVTLCYQALIPFERVYSSISVLTGYILRYLHEHGMVLPDRKQKATDWWVDEQFYKVINDSGSVDIQNLTDGHTEPQQYQIKGGHVEAIKGFYQYLLSYDYESLYPKILMMFNISPETKVIKPTQEQIIAENLIHSTINGVYYRREKGVLPSIVESIFGERKRFKGLMFENEELARVEQDPNKKKEYSYLAQYYGSQQLIRKIMINSMYGVLGSDFFHFFDVDNARAITRGGRDIIRYASSTINDYMKNNSHETLIKLFPNYDPKNIKPIKKDVVCVIDTDSNYINLEEVKTMYAPEMDFLEFATIMDEQFLDGFFIKILDIYANNKGIENNMNFKREGVITKQFVLAKKKYITELLKNEKTIYDPPKLKVTGVEVVRSDTPKFNQGAIESVILKILDTLDKDGVVKLIKGIKKDFKKQDIKMIATNKGINNYRKYAMKTSHYIENGLSYKSATPIQTRASICYNYMVKKFDLPYMEIDNGSKIKFIYIRPNNITKSNVIGFIGNYPPEFEKYFKIDYDIQFEKTFLSVINKMFDVLDWGEVNLVGSKLKKFVS